MDNETREELDLRVASTLTNELWKKLECLSEIDCCLKKYQLETDAVEIDDTDKTLRLNGALYLPRIKLGLYIGRRLWALKK